MGVISIKNLTKDYGENKGIFNLSIEIEEGEVFGFLGPNGAGKTTTIKHLLGFLNPDKGSLTINSLDCRKDAPSIQKILGYLPGEISFFDEMTGIEYLHFVANLRCQKDFSLMNNLMEYFELDAKSKIKKMSKGTKQKVGIVAAFMHDPKIIILDEPTSGLDPLMQNKFINFILEEKKKEKTIFMSSHNFEEIEKTCDRVAMIRKGKIIKIESISEIKKNQRKIYSITFENESDRKAFENENFEIVFKNEHRVDVAIKGNLKEFTEALAKNNISGIDVVSQSLEDIFMSYYGGEKNV